MIDMSHNISKILDLGEFCVKDIKVFKDEIHINVGSKMGTKEFLKRSSKYIGIDL